MDLLERAPALGDLDRWLAEARAGAGRLVLMSGEAGVGKTSLLTEFVARQQRPERHRRRGPIQLSWSGCDALTTPRPLGPLVDMAAALGGEVAELLRDEAPARERVGAARDALFDRLLDRLSVTGAGWVVVIEDLHWADEATLDMLRFLARRIARVPALILGTYRDDELGSGHPLRLLLGDLANVATVRRLSLGPLSHGAVAALAAGNGLDAEHLYATTGGNPFYVSEVIAAGGSEIPPTVRDAVLARAGRLSAPARRVLDAAVILAPPVETWLLAEVAGAAPGGSGREPEDLDECVVAGMLHGRPGGVEFRHELARLAIEQAVPPGRRAELHRRALAALLARPAATHDATRLAHHAEGAGDATAVLAHAVPAGRWAATLGAHRAAADQYGRALRFAAGLPPRELAELLELHSYECYLTSRADDAAASHARALACWRVVGDRLREGEALRWLSRIAWFRGDNAEAERAGHEAVTLLAGLSPGPELAMAYSNLAQLRMLAVDIPGAVRWGRLAIELAERLGLTDVLAHALNNVGTAESFADPVTGSAKLIGSLTLARAEGLEEHAARAFNNLASTAVATRRYAETDRWLAEGMAYCTERDLDSWRMSLLTIRARSSMDRGRWDLAVEDAGEVLGDPRTAPVTRGTALVVMGRVRARRGDPGVWPVLDEARALAHETGGRLRQVPVAVAWAEAAWLGGEPDRARAVVERTVASLPPRGDGADGWAVAELDHWHWRLRPPAPAAGPETGAPRVPGVPEPFALQASGDWAGAAEHWRALGCPYDAAWALAEIGRDTDLRAALAEFRRLGARPAAAAVSRRLREMGARDVTRGPQATTRANPAHLTGRELEVLALLTEGLRNGDIATRLFISVKTVDHHVSAILGKFGVRTRGEAVRAADRLDQPTGPP